MTEDFQMTSNCRLKITTMHLITYNLPRTSQPTARNSPRATHDARKLLNVRNPPRYATFPRCANHRAQITVRTPLCANHCVQNNCAQIIVRNSLCAPILRKCIVRYPRSANCCPQPILLISPCATHSALARVRNLPCGTSTSDTLQCTFIYDPCINLQSLL